MFEKTKNVAMAHSDGHELSAHLFSVAEIGQNFFSENFENASKWVYLAGLWHDLGKYRVGFQKYLALSADENAHIEGRVSGTEKTHSIAGALWANRVFKEKYGTTGNLASRILAYLIASHHAGLYDWYGGLNERLAEKDSATELAEALAAQPPEKILSAGDFDPVADMKKIPGGAPGFALWVRMMFSCLVDADFLDTEAHFDAKKAQSRKGFATIETLLPVFDDFMASKVSGAAISHVNVLRAEILKQCRDKANLEPGFFSLTVPTGGGKTLSSLAFALSHADLYCKRRIIYAIPYTSIIEQTADQFRQAFLALEADVLIEHHSQAEGEDSQETARSRLACENWDAPLIVTTNVQLFESMFAAKTSRCRKLHRLMNSVIVLDEAQQLPPEFLQPILDALKLLVAHYGVTVVFCTATQPALSTAKHFDASKGLKGIEGAREIMNDPDALCRQLDRVTIEWPQDFNQSETWPQVAQRIVQEDCVLTIVNSRKAARELHALLPEGTLHLSALMCGAHRSDVIAKIKQRLQEKRAGLCQEPLRVVATNLVEAGVDLDFPVVLRAVSGMDSIAQAAGRCNREGQLPGKGRVVVFVPPEKPPRGLPSMGAAITQSLVHASRDASLARGIFEAYFKALYYESNLDAQGIGKLLQVDKEFAVNFRTAAEKFQLIDDKDSAMVIVRYEPQNEEIEKLLHCLEAEGPQRWIIRKLQRCTVSIPQRKANAMLSFRSLQITTLPGLYVQADTTSLYSNILGLCTDDVPFNPALVT